jgi:hypothetical protein
MGDLEPLAPFAVLNLCSLYPLPELSWILPLDYNPIKP